MAQPIVIHNVFGVLRNEFSDYAIISFSKFDSSKLVTGIVSSNQDLTVDKIKSSRIGLNEVTYENVVSVMMDRFINVLDANAVCEINTILQPKIIVTDNFSFVMYHNSVSLENNVISYNCNTRQDPDTETYVLPNKPRIFKIVGETYTMCVYELKSGIELIEKG